MHPACISIKGHRVRMIEKVEELKTKVEAPPFP
jgi:hypothetical protein